MSKPKVIKDYEKLPEEIQEQIKLNFPYGFEKHLITFKNAEGKLASALPFETEDRYYLVRMTVAKAQSIVEEDDDFDEDGHLKEDVKIDLEEKYEDDMLEAEQIADD